MDVQNKDVDSIRQALLYNKKQLEHAFRLLWTRAALLALFCVIATLAAVGYCYGYEDLLWVVVPCSGMGLVFVLLMLDAWGQCREIRGRRWVSITPQIRGQVAQTDHVSTEHPSTVRTA